MLAQAWGKSPIRVVPWVVWSLSHDKIGSVPPTNRLAAEGADAANALVQWAVWVR